MKYLLMLISCFGIGAALTGMKYCTHQFDYFMCTSFGCINLFWFLISVKNLSKE